MKKIFLPIIGVAIFIVIVGLLTKKLQNDPSSLNFVKTQTQAPKSVTINQTKIDIDLANTNIKRRNGLSKRDSLPENQGMLFVFEDKTQRPAFWMKDMRFTIDIIWILDGKIIQIDSNVQLPDKDSKDKDLKLYTPEQPVDYVLEVNSGFSEKYNFKEGDIVDLSSI